MAKNNKITRLRDNSLRKIEYYLDRKTDKARKQRSQPLDEKVSPHRQGGFDVTTSTPVVNIPLTSTGNIVQTGFTHQGPVVTWTFRGGGGIEGSDVLIVNGNNKGLHKVNSAGMMIHDRGQLSVWIKGFNSGVASGTDEYILSMHQFNSDATPVDEESLVIFWDASEEELRLYPDKTNKPFMYFYIPILEVDWQEETWRQIRAKWSYQDQEWSLKFNDTEATTFEPETVPHPGWDEFTKIEVFTDLNGENDVFHDCQFLSFGQQAFDPIQTTISKTDCVTYVDVEVLNLTQVMELTDWTDATINFGDPAFNLNPDIVRNLQVRAVASIFGSMTGTVTINGIDANGSTIQEIFNINVTMGGATTYTGSRAFARVDSIVVDQTDANMGAQFSVGIGDKIGLPNLPFSSSDFVHKITLNGVDQDISGDWTINAFYGTCLPTVPIAGGDTFTFWYMITI